MLDQTRLNAGSVRHDVASLASRARPPQPPWEHLAESAILVLGSPRSGTTWLAKIFDSHPNVLYRHEPDECAPPNPALNPAGQITAWLRQRSLRAAGKRPQFRKNWRPPVMARTRGAVAAMLAGADRLAVLNKATTGLPLPDFVSTEGWGTVRAAVKLVNWDGTAAACSMPGVRCAYILRHPCGVIASVLAGRAAQRFRSGAEAMEGSAAGMLLAEYRAGVGPAAYAALPESARLAWTWIAFNEQALQGLGDCTNASIVLYEDLCREPEATVRSLFAFAGLDWNHQTAEFLSQSTQQDRGAGYFDVFRAGAAVADRWRQSLTTPDQDAIRAVVRHSQLASCWPDLGREHVNGPVRKPRLGAIPRAKPSGHRGSRSSS